MAIAAHHHHVFDQHGEVPVDVLALRHVGDDIALEGLGHGTPRTEIDPGETGTKPMMALNRVDLPLPLTPDQSRDGAARDRKAHVAQGRMPVAVGDGDTADGKARARGA